tara:strand:- start:274 stop:672 length:399 start_codon:yes stop_codon:yes gene_type:complete
MLFSIKDAFENTFVVTEKEYSSFIDLSNDHNPLHTDDNFAKSKGFAGRVMHGNILNAFLSYFIGEALPTKDVIIHSQEIQYKNPVYLNDELKFSAHVSGVYSSVNAIEFKFIFKNSIAKTVAKGKIQIGLLA